MNNWILSLVNTLILFVAVIVAGFLVGGRYTTISVQASNSSYMIAAI